MKLISEQKALDRLGQIKSDYKRRISAGFEHNAKSCLTCETQGACCLDAHFVNVHISRLEAVAIGRVLDKLPAEQEREVRARIDGAIERYGLTTDGDTYRQTYACPLFEKGTGCLVHEVGKPVPCITHACYENLADLPPDEMQAAEEARIDALNRQTYGRPRPLMSIPLALANSR